MIRALCGRGPEWALVAAAFTVLAATAAVWLA